MPNAFGPREAARDEMTKGRGVRGVSPEGLNSGGWDESDGVFTEGEKQSTQLTVFKCHCKKIPNLTFQRNVV